MHGRRVVLVLAAGAAIAGCTSVQEGLVERGYPPAYAAGYDDGCASGKAAAGGLFEQAEKDPQRSQGDSEYARGWDDGYQKCLADMRTMVIDARTRNPSRDK
jgi:hypothetical protein